MSKEYWSPRHREILTVCTLWPCPFDTDQIVGDSMRAYEKNTSVTVFEATRFLYSSICYAKVSWLGSSKSLWVFCICSGQMQRVRQQSLGPGLAEGKNGLLSCVGEKNGGTLKDPGACWGSQLEALFRVISEVYHADTRKNEIRLFHMVVQVSMTEDSFLCFFIEGSH